MHLGLETLNLHRKLFSEIHQQTRIETLCDTVDYTKLKKYLETTDTLVIDFVPRNPHTAKPPHRSITQPRARIIFQLLDSTEIYADRVYLGLILYNQTPLQQQASSFNLFML